MTPASRARSTSSFWLNAVSMTTGAIRSRPICSAARDAVEDRHLDVHDDEVGAQLVGQLARPARRRRPGRRRRSRPRRASRRGRGGSAPRPRPRRCGAAGAGAAGRAASGAASAARRRLIGAGVTVVGPDACAGTDHSAAGSSWPSRLRDADAAARVPGAGLEPARPCEQSILSAPCLPFHHPGRVRRQHTRRPAGPHRHARAGPAPAVRTRRRACRGPRRPGRPC